MQHLEVGEGTTEDEYFNDRREEKGSLEVFLARLRIFCSSLDKNRLKEVAWISFLCFVMTTVRSVDAVLFYRVVKDLLLVFSALIFTCT